MLVKKIYIMKDTEIILNNITKKLFGEKYIFSKMSERERSFGKTKEKRKVLDIYIYSKI